jgi:hypothetical protein
MPISALTIACGEVTIAACLGADMAQPVDREKKAVKVSDTLHRSLSMYALAAGTAGVGALALAQPAESEVVYTGTHQLIGSNQSYDIDLNDDGITDFAIRISRFMTAGMRSGSITALRVISMAICRSFRRPGPKWRRRGRRTMQRRCGRAERSMVRCRKRGSPR